MSIAFYHKLFHSSVLHERAHVPRGRGYCLAATTVKPWPDLTGLAIEPRLLTALAPLMLPTCYRAWLACGCTTVIVALAKSVVVSCESHVWAEPILAGAVGYVLADLGSGVYHWGIDNYGDALTLVFGTQIEAFQGHHKWPWTISRRQGADNLHALACAVVFVVGPIDFICKDPTMLGFVAVCSGCIMFGQQFHSRAHSTKSKLPPLVVAPRDLGLLVSRLQHAVHHWEPYNNNYSIVSGVWNEFLDDRKFGLRPRSWSEPSSKWTGDVEGEDLYQLEA
ncbi:hypothetical protein ACJRO7_022976 [Eucalyptus globulus]|uniref:Lipid desaturase domain-containing protein n=1 Tax=Eucalyptus globulus TaxID=34317 RepID=A0ABD3K4P6_EUCGL